MTRVHIVWEFRLERGDSFGGVLEPFELWTGVVDGCVAGFGDDCEGVVRTDVDGSCLRRVLGIECMSECPLPLFTEIG